MTDKEYMRRAIELAKKGIGKTDPNPLVGAVIVKDNKIIGEGFHERYGGLHAERNAIASLKSDAAGADMYVTLEPCCHYGKTPPCTEAIIENKIGRVIVGSRDPNPLVAGKGAGALRDAGIEVETDFLRDECDALNKKFFHFITTGRPYVLLKYAMTADGKIATKTGASKWISSEKSREFVHGLRNEYPAILAGIGTVLADDPMLTARIEDARNPLRVIVDTNLKIPADCNILKTAKEIPTLIAYSNASIERIREVNEAGAETLELPESNGHVDLSALMEALGEKNISGVLTEGGAGINYGMFKAGLVDEVNVFVAPKVFGGAGARSPVEGEGVSMPDEAFGLEFVSSRVIGDDVLLTYRGKKT